MNKTVGQTIFNFFDEILKVDKYAFEKRKSIKNKYKMELINYFSKKDMLTPEVYQAIETISDFIYNKIQKRSLAESFFVKAFLDVVEGDKNKQ